MAIDLGDFAKADAIVKEATLKGRLTSGAHGVAREQVDGIPLLGTKHVFQLIILGDTDTSKKFIEAMDAMNNQASLADHPIDIEVRLKRSPIIDSVALEV